MHLRIAATALLSISASAKQGFDGVNSVAAAVSPAEGAQPASGQERRRLSRVYTLAGNNWCTFNGADPTTTFMPGTGLGTTREQCGAACDSDLTCGAYEYYPAGESGTTCYKNDEANGSAPGGIGNSECWIPVPRVYTLAGNNWCTLNGADVGTYFMPGTSMSTTRDQCGMACDRHSDCGAFEYYPAGYAGTTCYQIVEADGSAPGGTGNSECWVRAPPSCAECTNKKTRWMKRRGKNCRTATRVIGRQCNESARWVENEYCQQACFEAGRGYDGVECCESR